MHIESTMCWKPMLSGRAVAPQAHLQRDKHRREKQQVCAVGLHEARTQLASRGPAFGMGGLSSPRFTDISRHIPPLR